MKQFKLVLALLIVALTSCSETGLAKVEQTLVVEQVNINENVDKDCSQCNIGYKYKYNMKIRTHSGSIYYYTDYKHEVGDTLLSSNMFIQQEVESRSNMKNEITNLQKINDSLMESNNTMKFQYDLMVSFYEKNVINKKDE